ncbi:hypothetical protein L798_09070 [Zootermopsis nevadensis]|uniref:Uncharacterized protein n=1 Tax=Zootermopsis nevadensis TaxID=136037 RepID=A0A067RD34_ZOONE|nr:hypothetical protein L798_09070 [Zootermopsis nevadensis]
MCRYPKKNHFHQLFGNSPRFGNHCSNRSEETNIVDVRSHRGADCDSGHYLVTENLRVRILARKETGQVYRTEKFNVERLIDVETKQEYQLKISNRLATLQNVEENTANREIDDNMTWENIRDNIKI